MNGITWITVLSLFCGLLAHGLKQLITAKRSQSDISVRNYAVVHWPESLLSVVSASVLYLGLPEIASIFPDLSSTLGVGKSQSVLSSFVVGYMANSLADFLGGRARSITGAE